MKNSPYNKMFSVSKEKTLIKNLKTGEITGDKQVKTGYDLTNCSVYDIEGNLISEENQLKYNSIFLLKIAHLKIVEVRNFLNYHLERTPDQLAFIDYVQFAIANAKEIHAGTKAAIENWAVEVRSSNSNNRNKFKYFDLYFSAVNQLLSFSEGTLYKTKDLTEEYFTITRDYESKNNLYWSDFQNEIRNNVTDFERQDKIKIYLEQIQTALNRVYDFVESKNQIECNGKLRFHSSIVSVQNLCRDLAIKNNIELVGDVSSKTNEVLPHYFNEYGQSLFNYLKENYNRAKGKQKYINIYHFMRDLNFVESKNYKEKIIFNCSHDEYRNLVANFGIELIKINKPINYDTVQLPILRDLQSKWRIQLSMIE